MSSDKRIHARVKTNIRGKFSCFAEADYQDCVLTDISLGGALLKCANAQPVGSRVVLRADGFDNVAGVVARTTCDGMAISFDDASKTREKLAEEILIYLGGNRRSAPRTRRHERLEVPQDRQFTRASGQLVNFDIADLSLSGASLITKSRPPIGELLEIGKSCGRVVRHMQAGIAVEFITQAH